MQNSYGGFLGAVAAGLITAFVYGWYVNRKGGSVGGVSPVSSSPSYRGIAEQTNPQGPGGLGSQPADNPAQQSDYLSATSPLEIEAAAYSSSRTSRATPAKVQSGFSSSTLLSGGPEDCTCGG